MIRSQTISLLCELRRTLGASVDGSEWYLFGSVDRNEKDAADIDLLILCKSDAQADELRGLLDIDCFSIPLHLSLMTFEEDLEVGATLLQKCTKIAP